MKYIWALIAFCLLLMPAQARLNLERLSPVTEPTFDRFQLKFNETIAYPIQKNFEKLEQMVVDRSSSTVTITAAGGISVATSIIRPTANSAIDITANPQIAVGKDGQEIRIEGTSNTNTIKLDDGAGLQLQYGQSFTLGQGDVIALQYNLNRAIWTELWRANND